LRLAASLAIRGPVTDRANADASTRQRDSLGRLVAIIRSPCSAEHLLLRDFAGGTRERDSTAAGIPIRERESAAARKDSRVLKSGNL
jgi:hypothetical protein